MNYPFPGMDPFLEHPVLWERAHARLIVTIADQLQPKLDPRYITSIEERVFIEPSKRRPWRANVTSSRSTCSAGAGMFRQSPSGASRG